MILGLFQPKRFYVYKYLQTPYYKLPVAVSYIAYFCLFLFGALVLFLFVLRMAILKREVSGRSFR